MEEKNQAIIDFVVEKHKKEQPVLLITRTAEAAEYFSANLFQLDIPNNLLIAQNVSKEAQMIAEAGNRAAVTVATSMAGRGTDIKLAQGVHEIGGLAVIINEHMENSRVDRQLRGRSGRQGDPGVSQIFVSLDDYIVKKWSQSKMIANDKLKKTNSEILENSKIFQMKVNNIVNKEQTVSEETSIVQREMANEFEKSISVQRDLIYKERDRILDMVDKNQFDYKQLAKNVFRNDLKNFNINDKKDIISYIYKNLSFNFEANNVKVDVPNQEAIVNFLTQHFIHQFEDNQKKASDPYFILRYIQKSIIKAIDMAWIEQVDYLQQLKANVNNRQNGQRNAIFEYHKVALESYESMTIKLKRNIIRNLCLSIITFDKHGDLVIYFP